MTDEPQKKLVKPKPSLSQEVDAKAKRKLKARRYSAQGVWFGLGMMGLIGWSVVYQLLRPNIVMMEAPPSIGIAKIGPALSVAR
jgi:predicted F0F1-ATPase subunit